MCDIKKRMCDEDRAKIEWKRILVDAFDITPLNLDFLHLSENTIGLELLFDLLGETPTGFWHFS